MNIEFSSLTPEELKYIPLTSSLIITTSEEMTLIKHDNILLDNELNDDIAVVKAKILSITSNYGKNILLIGIDPGKRIGLSLLYNYDEIDSRVVSIHKLADLIEMLIDEIDADKVIIRVGNGDPILAFKIAYELSIRVKVDIELVDEHGTTKDNLRRGVRDKVSAKMIALRKGVRFKPSEFYTHKINHDLALSH
ncbi:MAG: hypothetical protein QW416_02410 [Candidatus Nitrosocaldaceae archaeon]